ncbi:MAG: hypothetical protein H6765_02790 [Candidatus Peribacteria bacterium]|nr:MAG: hypothetical protein H6765_02790 [Candidatus Peribacteria bacterium]
MIDFSEQDLEEVLIKCMRSICRGNQEQTKAIFRTTQADYTSRFTKLIKEFDTKETNKKIAENEKKKLFKKKDVPEFSLRAMLIKKESTIQLPQVISSTLDHILLNRHGNALRAVYVNGNAAKKADLQTFILNALKGSS